MRRLLFGALLLYLGADYCDAALPGVFCFDTESFYVDAAVQPRGSAQRTRVSAPAPPVPAFAADVRGTAEERVGPARAPVREGPPLSLAAARDGSLPVKTPVEEH